MDADSAIEHQRGARDANRSGKTSVDVYRLLSDVATGIWRARRKMLPDGASEPPPELRSSWRHLESVWDALACHGVEVRDHTGERYVAGMALRVIAFQPTVGVQGERIIETIKPTVYCQDHLIQRGEVVVGTAQGGADGSGLESAGLQADDCQEAEGGGELQAGGDDCSHADGLRNADAQDRMES
ncbi:MAG: hypothetical protein IPM29_10690 [Planctomycetes bacterium]|nr:hypothetical protein [Planctomycetota bacterium]